MRPDSRIYVAGSDTLIGAAVVRELRRRGHRDLIGDPGQEPKLTDAGSVDALIRRTKPEYVILAAGKSGGIQANVKYPAELMLDNLLAASHVISCAHRHGVRKLIYLASSCCYPRESPQPMSERSLLTGPLEPTNESYALAKIAGIGLAQAYRRQFGAKFIVGIPANAFGPGEDFSPEDSHVIPALLRKMHEAKAKGEARVEIWGTGSPRREFIFADDLADACLFVMERYDEAEPINLGGAESLSIKELAVLAKEVVGYDGKLEFNAERPNGMPLKMLDSTKLRAMGWRPKTAFRAALEATYQWYLQNERTPQKAARA